MLIYHSANNMQLKKIIDFTLASQKVLFLLWRNIFLYGNGKCTCGMVIVNANVMLNTHRHIKFG